MVGKRGHIVGGLGFLHLLVQLGRHQFSKELPLPDPHPLVDQNRLYVAGNLGVHGAFEEAMDVAWERKRPFHWNSLDRHDEDQRSAAFLLCKLAGLASEPDFARQDQASESDQDDDYRRDPSEIEERSGCFAIGATFGHGSFHTPLAFR